MNKIFHRKDGQVAPFMIAIIVVLIMAIMVTVNIGKVSLTKTRTANAADAGALAGSTTHANTLNNIADINTMMIAEWLSTQAIFAIPTNISTEFMRYLTYLAFVISQAAQFVLAWQAGIEGYEGAENGARQLAFMNGGIDEAKIRLAGESYQSYLLRESPFGQWMESGGYESSGVYSWADKDGEQNSFTVDVTAPDFPMLIPMPMVLFSFYFKWIPMCTPCGKIPCCNCLSCNQAAADFLFRVNQANRTLFFNVGPPGVTPISINPNTNAGVTVPPFCPCGSFFAWAWATYFVP
ncbi:MAG: pilus assembly protein TadG-related protein, partial [Dehalococcoidales bacterium]|nr:pilus assembly protein TadG-related protein [Dehalococcoidales bacterium]